MALSDKALAKLVMDTNLFSPCRAGRIMRERIAFALTNCELCDQPLEDTAVYHPRATRHPGCLRDTVGS